MKIRFARTAGFCMGVRRAVDMVLDLQRGNTPLPIVTYGPLIHNPQTLEILDARGVTEAGNIEEIDRGTVVVRAHGISPAEHGLLKEKGLQVVDATCPRVRRVQVLVERHAGQGRFCVIVGDADHPEVRGVMGFATAGGVALAEANLDQMSTLVPSDREVCVVAQTTQDRQTFEKVVRALERHCLKIHVHDTICDSTKRRQQEVTRLARQVDLVVVVGGKGSGNTRRLAQVAEACGARSLHVETAGEIDPKDLDGVSRVGVTGGASTPNWQMRQAVDRIKEISATRRSGPLRRLRRAVDAAVMTYGFAALGGGGLTATCMTLQGETPTWPPLVVAMLFVFSMHLLNRLHDRSGAVRFNSPEIAAFYARHTTALTAAGLASSLGAIVLALGVGITTCILLTCTLVMGRLYSAALFSASGNGRNSWLGLRDVPWSKTPAVTFGWAFVAAVLPVVEAPARVNFIGLAVAFVLAAGMVFWRMAVSDLMDVQGDRIVGRQTIPVVLGVDQTRKILWILLVLLGGYCALGVWMGWISAAGYVLEVNMLLFAVLFVFYARRQLADRLLYEGAADLNFVLAGILVWQAGM
ncbi:MAG: 4-hydroxy-3-methylbut-2-enyl diphosphate reductase [Thermodesulfobacteriota bacterium]